MVGKIWVKVYPFNGEIYFFGNTYPIKDELKRMGFRFTKYGAGRPTWWKRFDDVDELMEILERVKPDNIEEVRECIEEIRRRIIERALLKYWKPLFEEKKGVIGERLVREFGTPIIPEIWAEIEKEENARIKFYKILAGED